MKSLKDYSLNLSEADYHAYPAWSYSLIARYARDGFGSLAALHTPITPTPAMEFGSLVDAMVTRPDDIINEYAVSDTVPPPAEKKVLDALLTITNTPFMRVAEEEIKAAIDMAEYQKNWKFDTQYKHIVEYSEYYDIRRTGRKIVSSQDWLDAIDMRNAIWTHPLAGTLFQHGDEFLYQIQFAKKIWLEAWNVEIKAMLDLLKVDHKAKTLQPIDLKTSSTPGYDFANSFTRMRYDLQASLYTALLKEVIKDTEEYKDYTILPFLFIDISRQDKVPVVYSYDPNDESQLDGLAFKEYKYKSWDSLLCEILSYEENEAVVPFNIRMDKEPNNLLDLLNA